jgi:hypothetical protein
MAQDRTARQARRHVPIKTNAKAKGALRNDERKGPIALERLIKISIALSRMGEIESLFSPTPIHLADELSLKPQRQSGRRRRRNF